MSFILISLLAMKVLTISECYLRMRKRELEENLKVFARRLESPSFTRSEKQKFHYNVVRLKGQIKEIENLISILSERKKTMVVVEI